MFQTRQCAFKQWYKGLTIKPSITTWNSCVLDLNCLHSEPQGLTAQMMNHAFCRTPCKPLTKKIEKKEKNSKDQKAKNGYTPFPEIFVDFLLFFGQFGTLELPTPRTKKKVKIMKNNAFENPMPTALIQITHWNIILLSTREKSLNERKPWRREKYLGTKKQNICNEKVKLNIYECKLKTYE